MLSCIITWVKAWRKGSSLKRARILLPWSALAVISYLQNDGSKLAPWCSQIEGPKSLTFRADTLISVCDNLCDISAIHLFARKDYEEVGIETAEGEGEEEGYGDEF